MHLIQSTSLDPHWNLAIEEALLDGAQQGEPVLYLWQSKSAVVIGKNQNPWRECQCVDLEKKDGYLARRVSGGGAVYHDEGNLNFSLFLPRTNYQQKVPFSIVLNALGSLGIEASMMGRNSIAVDNFKVSGNAFCFRKNRVLHHGTLLVESNLHNLRYYLNPALKEINTKATSSIPAAVSNLTRFDSRLDIQLVSRALVDAFEDTFEGQLQTLTHEDLDQEHLHKLYAKYQSWEWTYGHTPTFDVKLSKRVSEQDIFFHVQIEKGRISSVKRLSRV
ncbi:MAG: lipoate--protein ligase [Kiritimatiellae bacterium]|nr:lipoate--protein ligase [Kiritimatiellia bacterium]